MPKTRVPAIEGWFTTDEASPTLLGARCAGCGTYSFPPGGSFCPNPACEGTELEPVPLSRRGRGWSYTDARYAPPAPYVAPEPYHPFALAAVELEAERMVVLGQLVPGVTVDDVQVGDVVELVLDTLYEDEEHQYVVWKWRPVGAGPAAGTAGEGGSDR